MDFEELLAYMNYESQQYISIKQEGETVSAKEVVEKVSVFDHSSDEESDKYEEEIQRLENLKQQLPFDQHSGKLFYADKIEKLKEKQVEKKEKSKGSYSQRRNQS